MEELARRGRKIREKVRAEFIPEDFHLLPKSRRANIVEWCDQVPVFGFNSGRYNLNLIKEYFGEQMSCAAGNIKAAKDAKKIMFLLTKGFKFLNIINYLGPGTSYDKWVKLMIAKLKNCGSRMNGLIHQKNLTSQGSPVITFGTRG